jgi:hypothetical protein
MRGRDSVSCEEAEGEDAPGRERNKGKDEICRSVVILD